MIRNSITTTILSLTVLAAFIVPGQAGEPKKEPKLEDVISIFRTEVQKLEALNRDIARKLDGIKDNLGTLEGNVVNLRIQQLELKHQLDSQKAVIDQLLRDRDKLIANSSPIDKRISNYGPTAPTMGRVMLVNLYSEPVLFTVNNIEHIVPAGKSKLLEGIPSGSVNYDVFANRHGFLERQSVMLLPGETYTLTVFPRR